MADGVRAVGAAEVAGERPEEEPTSETPVTRRTARTRPAARPRGFVALIALAVLGAAGTIGFAAAWAGTSSGQPDAGPVTTAATTFVDALTNFTAKSVDADFNNITSMATGQFATQANKFFNSAIRQELEQALASSRGQIRNLYIESISGNQASVYAVVDQFYVNNRLSAPATDVLRMVVGLTNTSDGWKISNVTVLEGPSLGAGGASSSPNSSSTTTTTAAP